MKVNIATSQLTLPERHNYIMDALRKHGSVSVVALAEQLNVSEVTIRKDLSLLEKKKKLYRAHGSAILINPYINDRHVNDKEKINAEDKRAIGRCASEMIAPNDTILIASGTTMMALAREIEAKENLTAITAATNVAMILAKNKNVDVIQLGGLLRNSSVSVVGPYAEQMLVNFSCSKLFIGVDGIDLDFGLTTTNMMEANLNRVMINSAQKVIVLTDSSKFGRKGFSKICDIQAVDHIVTDKGIPQITLDQLTELGIEVTVVGN